MSYDFTTIIERRGTNCIKYDAALRRKGRDDLLPLWVADMDLALPEEILAPIHDAVAHGIFGYTFAGEDCLRSITSWFSRRHNWEIDPNSITLTPGVVVAIGAALQAFTSEGDGVLIQEPVYYPFAQLIKANNRTLVNNELIYSEGRYSIDFEDFEKQIIQNQVKLFILCSPHNPIGRVWSADELKRMGEICLRHNVFVIADEIHSDFTYPNHKHQVFANLSPEFATHTMTCNAPSKTFNLAGLQAAFTVITDPEKRLRYQKVFQKLGYDAPGVLSLVGLKAVYERGEGWLDALKIHLQENLSFFREYLREHIPQAKLIEPEGTYLVWVDFFGLGLDDEELEKFIVEKARLWLDGGEMFSTLGRSGQFQRFNIACPRETLQQALEQLKSAVDTLKEGGE